MPNSDDWTTPDAPSAPRLVIECSIAGAEAVVTAVGEIDPHTTELLTDAITESAAQAGVSTVAIQLAGVTFIDSSGLRTLISAQRSLEDRSVEMVVRTPSLQVSRLFDIVGLDEHIRVQP